MKPLALCSDTFAVLYSQTSKTPLVVVERLNAAQLKDAKGEERTNQFYADPRIPKGGRAELSDYRSQHPAVDRGHQAPAADAPNAHAMAQSFALSNMVPQDPTNPHLSPLLLRPQKSRRTLLLTFLSQSKGSFYRLSRIADVRLHSRRKPGPQPSRRWKD